VFHRNRETSILVCSFCDMDTAARVPRALPQVFGTIIPPNDNKFAALMAVWWEVVHLRPRGVVVDQPLQATSASTRDMGSSSPLDIADKVPGALRGGCRLRCTRLTLHSADVEWWRSGLRSRTHHPELSKTSTL